jgi:glycosyltransferase involved in cell wall biosynthesis
MKSCTFIVTSFNHELYIEEALNSVENQDIIVDELIITEDASTDNTRILIEKFIKKSKIKKIHFIKNDINRGLNYCLNQAFTRNTSDIILIQAGDDISSIDRVKITKQQLVQSSCIAIMTSYVLIDNNGVVIKEIYRDGIYNSLRNTIKRGSAIPGYGMAFKRELIEIMDPLDENISNEDDILGFNAVLYGGIKLVKKPLYFYRIHENSMSNWALSSDSSFLLLNFYKQLINRKQNYNSWEREYSKIIEPNLEIISLLKTKITIIEYFFELKNKSLINRLIFLYKNLFRTSKREKIILLFGEYGVILIPRLRKILINYKKL